jgi:molecular chaperone GrpE
MMSDREQSGEPAPDAGESATDLAGTAGPGFDDALVMGVLEQNLGAVASDTTEPPWPAAAQPAQGDPPIGAQSATDASIVLDAVSNLAERLGRRIDGLQTIFERELRAEATRERVIDRLHAELQEYKSDLLLKIQRPIFVDLIQLHDDIAKMIEAKASTSGESESGTGLRGLLESVQTAIEDILYRQGVEPFLNEGTDFDPRRQRAVATVPASEPALNKTVAARVRKGFTAGEKIIRPEIVTVYTWRQSPPVAEA